MTKPTASILLAAVLIPATIAAMPAEAQTVIYRTYPSEERREYYYPYGRQLSPQIIRSDIENSTLVRPVIIDSTIENSTIINPRIESSRSSPRVYSREYRQGQYHRQRREQTNPACMEFTSMRIACQ